MANISHFTQTVNGVSTTYDIHDANAVDLSSNQTVGGNKEFTGTTTAHDLVPSATDTYNFGSPSVQWNNAYIKSLTINGVACGDILTHNASEFVNVSSNQTITGVKTFNFLSSKSNNLERGTLPTTNINEDPIFIAVDKNNRRTLAFFNYYNTNGNGRVVLYAYNQNAASFDNIGLVFNFDNVNSSKSVYPIITNNFDLGTLTNKWKSFNGINPGVLSLPNKSSYINIDTTNWDLTCSNQGVMANYTVEESGWLLLQIRHGSADIVDLWLVTDSIRMNSKSTLNTLDNRNFNMISLPVVKGETLRIFGDASQYVAGRIIEYARIYRSLGNV